MRTRGILSGPPVFLEVEGVSINHPLDLGGPGVCVCVLICEKVVFDVWAMVHIHGMDMHGLLDTVSDGWAL